MAEAVAVAALPSILAACCPCCTRQPEEPPTVQVHVTQTVGPASGAASALASASAPGPGTDVLAAMMDEMRTTLQEVRRDVTEAHRRRVSQQFHDRMQQHLETLRHTWFLGPGAGVAPVPWHMKPPGPVTDQSQV